MGWGGGGGGVMLRYSAYQAGKLNFRKIEWMTGRMTERRAGAQTHEETNTYVHTCTQDMGRNNIWNPHPSTHLHRVATENI